jgi:cob(I)alamin adenosyltransferase
MGKESLVMELLGRIDEFDSSLNKSKYFVLNNPNSNLLKYDIICIHGLLNKIITLNRKLGDDIHNCNFVSITIKDINSIVKSTDKYKKNCEPITSFVSFNKIDAIELNESRVRIRAVERKLIKYNIDHQIEIPEIVLDYVNKLSTLLFYLAYYLENKKY